MCHRVRVMLLAEDKAAAKTISGWLIPVYAVAVLALIAGVAVTSVPRHGELVASTSTAAPAR
jgi:hypothetical protein